MTTEEINKIQEWFADNHSYMYINQVDSATIESFWEREYIKNLPFERQCDCFRDYLLANDLVEIDL
jgi:hypothetical protein